MFSFLRHRLLSGSSVHEGTAIEYCLCYLVRCGNSMYDAYWHFLLQRKIQALRLHRTRHLIGRNHRTEFIITHPRLH